MTVAQLDPVLRELDREMSQTFEVIELERAVMDCATQLAQAHALRAADAVQLACAIHARRDAAAAVRAGRE
jgi:predicted nucleic acid-binding protein